jgi:hypothetical protein
MWRGATANQFSCDRTCQESSSGIVQSALKHSQRKPSAAANSILIHSRAAH